MSTNATTAAIAHASEHDNHPELRRRLKRNFLAHALDGGIFMGGVKLLAPAVVMPKMVETLGGPGWLIAAMPIMMGVGMQAPGLLTAHLIERLGRLRPLLLLTGVFQRLPFLVAGAALLLWSDAYPVLVLSAVVACQFLSGLFGGMGQTAWSEYVANSIPTRRRSSLWATRHILGALIGLAAAGAVKLILHVWPGPPGYAALHFGAFGLLTVSYVVFWMTREVPNPRTAPTDRIGLIESLRRMPATLRGEPAMRRYLVMILFGAGMNIMVPFLSIHVLKVLGRSEAFLGELVAAQMIGGIVGNFLAAYAGDRHGSKGVVFAAYLGLLAVCVWAAFVVGPWGARGLFCLFGAAASAMMVGRSSLNLELCALHHRVRHLAIINAVSLIGGISAWAVATMADTLSRGAFGVVATLAAVCVIAATLCLLGVKEPRRATDRA